MERIERYIAAAAQIPQSDSPDENLREMLRVLEDTDAQLICFPETSLTGPNQNTDLASYHRQIAERVSRRGVYAVYGGYVREEVEVYNRAFLVNPDGQIQHTYAKKHLWREESHTTVPGSGPNIVVETPLGKLGIIICWDIAHTSSIRELARQGAEVILCPSYWFAQSNTPYDTTQVIEGVPLSRAFESQAYFVYCDASSPQTAQRSKICSPTKVLAQAHEGEQIITAQIDRSLLPGNRRYFDCWR